MKFLNDHTKKNGGWAREKSTGEALPSARRDSGDA
jgi:hypothetical protein